MPTKINEIDRIFLELGSCIYPSFLKEEDSILKKGVGFSLKKAEKYFDLIFNINWFLKKIFQYKLYFLYFYPRSRRIKQHDALEHHIHAYLEDLQSLRERLNVYVGTLKKDLNKIATNKKEIEAEFKQVKDEIYKAFSDVSKSRNPHRHEGNIFFDTNAVHGRSANMLLTNDIIRNQLTKYGLEKLQTKEAEHLKKGKKEWSDLAGKNYQQVFGLTETLLRTTKTFLYKILDIEPNNRWENSA